MNKRIASTNSSSDNENTWKRKFSKTTCWLTLFTAIVQSVTIERNFRCHEYRFLNNFKRTILQKKIKFKIVLPLCDQASHPTNEDEKIEAINRNRNKDRDMQFHCEFWRGIKTDSVSVNFAARTIRTIYSLALLTFLLT